MCQSFRRSGLEAINTLVPKLVFQLLRRADVLAGHCAIFDEAQIHQDIFALFRVLSSSLAPWYREKGCHSEGNVLAVAAQDLFVAQSEVIASRTDWSSEKSPI
jgi:hypothetical protein